MTEGLISRISRIVRGSMIDQVDQMEKSFSVAVMKASKREVEVALDAAKAASEQARNERTMLERRMRMTKDRIQELNSKSKTAIANGRDDLIRAVAERQLDLEAAVPTIQAEIEQAEAQLEKFDALAGVLEERLASMHIEVEQEDVHTEGRRSPEKSIQRAFDRAEKAFNRVAGASAGTSSADTLVKLKELDQMDRSRAVEERMAALKNNAA